MTNEAPRENRVYRIDPAVARARGSLGGAARAASQTPEERSEAGRRAVNARWARYRAEREARGDTATKRPPSTPHDPEMLDYWRGVVREEQPDRVWTSAQELKRAAISRAKQEQARMILDAAKNRGAE
jgi:hypothetical protein